MKQNGAPKGWRQVKLKEVCREITVGHVGPMADEYVEEGVPFLRSQNIQPFRLELAGLKYIDPEFHARLKKSSISPGDVVVVRTGYPGTACVVPQGMNPANCADLVIVRPSSDLDSWFLASIFNSAWGRGTVAGKLVGVAHQHFNIGAAKEMIIHLPPVESQRKIAVALAAYDDLIDNNTRRIRILEEVAQAIHREWFVHFRFPGDKKVKLVPSPLGPIPEGWSIKKATEAIAIDPPTKVPRDGEKPFVPMSSLSNDSMLIIDIESRSGNSGSKFKNNDTLFARITPCLENGKTAYVQFLPTAEDVAFGSTEFIVMRSITLCPEFVYLLARLPEFRGNAIKSMSGATGRQRVQPACFDKFLLVHPDKETIAAFEEQVSPIFRGVQLLARKNAILRTTRDLLLPKLISGELDVSELDINVRDGVE